VNQMIYKSAVSTVVPSRNVKMPTMDDNEAED
jgi:sRNA-binding regulator protein Hfq